MPSSKTYSYTDKALKPQSAEVSDDIFALVEKADNRYATARKYVDSYYTPIWRWAEKAYQMSTADRAQYIKPWQSNICFGLIRSFIDVFVSTLSERPINFNVEGYNELGEENAPFIQHALTTTADVTGFQSEIRHAMTEALKTGTFAFRIGMLPSERNHTIIDSTDPENPKELTFESRVTDFPTAKYVDVFNIFPDPHSWPLQYVTERYITSIEDAIETYSSIISQPSNKSPLKAILPLLGMSKNQNQADFTDNAAIRYQIPQYEADQMRKDDYFARQSNTQGMNTTTAGQTHDHDLSANMGKCEVREYTDIHHKVIFLNNYPVYIGTNDLGFINYVIKATNTQNTKLGFQGMAYLLKGPATMMDSVMNNHIDCIRAVASPNFTYPQGAFLDEKKLEDLAPGEAIAMQAEYAPQGLKRIDKWGVTDFGIFDLAMKVAQYISGASEYNLGGSTKERTATGANAATQSSLKRLSPFMAAFVEAVTEIAEMWVRLGQDNWTQEKYLSVSGATKDEIKQVQKLANAKLTGAVGITLNVDSMIESVNELLSRNMLEMWNQLAGRWIIDEKEFVKEMMRSRWLKNPLLVMPDAPQVSKWEAPPLDPATQAPTAEAQMGQALTDAMTPQVNLGNEGLGPQ